MSTDRARAILYDAPVTDVIDRFYTAFAAGDAATMSACYDDRATFSDPVFPDLDAAGARAMWAMLVGRATDLRVEHADVAIDGDQASARWIAHYTFSATGRPVVNRIRARFTLKDGKILRHRDDFDFWRWSRQALGTSGLLLGWTPIVRGAVRRQAAAGLAAYRAKADAA